MSQVRPYADRSGCRIPALPQRATKSRRGHTLAEVMTALSIGVMVFGGVLSSFVFLNRGMVSLGHYHEMNRSGQIATEELGRRIRTTEQILHAEPHELEVLLPGANGDSIRSLVRYDPKEGKLWLREEAREVVLLDDLQDFAFGFFGREGETTRALEIRQISIRAVMKRQVSQRDNTHYAFSARYVLRNRFSGEGESW